MQVALLQSSALQAIFEDLGVAQADLVQARLVRNPSLAGFFRFPTQAPWGLNWNAGMDFWPLDVFLVPLRTRLAGATLAPRCGARWTGPGRRSASPSTTRTRSSRCARA